MRIASSWLGSLAPGALRDRDRHETCYFERREDSMQRWIWRLMKLRMATWALRRVALWVMAGASLWVLRKRRPRLTA